MSRKNLIFLLNVTIILSVLSIGGCFQSSKQAKPITFVVDSFSPTAEDFIVADKFDSTTENFEGPWGSAVIENETLKFDVSGAWCTLNFMHNEQFYAGGTNTFKYAVITLRSDKPGEAINATMTLGNKQKYFTEWKIAFDTVAKTYAIDLAAHGVTNWGDEREPTYAPDFAMNNGGATSSYIYIERIILTNRELTN
ncbi:MAG: hypothetical protein GX493_09660 [Firmicutes bacterium]|nr:hypothetical protein [Bacillota bacterium]